MASYRAIEVAMASLEIRVPSNAVEIADRARSLHEDPNAVEHRHAWTPCFSSHDCSNLGRTRSSASQDSTQSLSIRQRKKVRKLWFLIWQPRQLSFGNAMAVRGTNEDFPWTSIGNCVDLLIHRGWNELRQRKLVVPNGLKTQFYEVLHQQSSFGKFCLLHSKFAQFAFCMDKSPYPSSIAWLIPDSHSILKKRIVHLC